MGSVLSKRATSAALRSQASKRSAAVRGESLRSGSEAKEVSSPSDPRVTAEQQQPPGAQPPYHRQTTDEWAQTLKQISGVISSSAWEGASAPGSVNPEATGSSHAARRGEKASGKLPRNVAKSEEGGEREKERENRLTQNQILALFSLRRRDPADWGANQVAKRFGVEEADARDLLKFTRTYTGRLDEDGSVRGYYKADPENTIVRFERD